MCTLSIFLTDQCRACEFSLCRSSREIHSVAWSRGSVHRSDNRSARRELCNINAVSSHFQCIWLLICMAEHWFSHSQLRCFYQLCLLLQTCNAERETHIRDALFWRRGGNICSSFAFKAIHSKSAFFFLTHPKNDIFQLL